MFKFEAFIDRNSRAMAKIVNNEAGHKGRKNRVHDWSIGSI